MWDCVVEMLGFVGIFELCKCVDVYLHEFFGGMCQCVMIVMVLVNDLKLLIVDELMIAFDVIV